jgi:hypothetical protein
MYAVCYPLVREWLWVVSVVGRPEEKWAKAIKVPGHCNICVWRANQVAQWCLCKWRRCVRVNLEEEREDRKHDPDVSSATYQTKVTATKVKKLYQLYYSRRGRTTKEEQAEHLHQEQKRLQGSRFLEIPNEGDTKLSSIESAKWLHQN